MAQIIRITSEALQQTVRRLLPSQQGFGEDLEASNVITPIIDLTPTAEGSNLPTYIQIADGFGSNTSFFSTNATTLLASSGGFYRVRGTAVVSPDPAAARTALFKMSDGLASKNLWVMEAPAGATGLITQNFDLTYFLRSGDSLSAETTSTDCTMAGSIRQVATLTGELINPTGFNPE